VLRVCKFYKERKSAQLSEYKALYRFESENVQWLADYFIRVNEKSRGGALSPVQRMRIFLRYMAVPGFQQGIGEELGCSQPTVLRVVSKMLSSVLQHADKWIWFPTTRNEM